MNLFKRIKRSWELAKKDSQVLNELTDEQITEIPDEDTKAVFFGRGTKEEFEDFQREEEGTKAWYDRLEQL